METSDTQMLSIGKTKPSSEITDEQADRYFVLCGVIKKHECGFYEVAEAMHEIKELRLWAVEHSSWDEFVRSKFGFSGKHATRVISLGRSISAANVKKNLPPMNSAAELKRISDPKRRKRVWKTACKAAEKEGKKRPNLASVAKLVDMEIDAGNKVTTMDWAGNEISGDMADVFTNSRELMDSKNDIKQIRKRILSMAGQPGMELVSPGAIEQALSAVESLIGSMIPYSICLNPGCEAGCVSCHGHGWINEHDYKSQKKELNTPSF